MGMKLSISLFCLFCLFFFLSLLRRKTFLCNEQSTRLVGSYRLCYYIWRLFDKNYNIFLNPLGIESYGHFWSRMTKEEGFYIFQKIIYVPNTLTYHLLLTITNKVSTNFFLFKILTLIKTRRWSRVRSVGFYTWVEVVLFFLCVSVEPVRK